MNNKSNEKLSDEILDTPLDEGNETRLETVQKSINNKLFYVIAGTSAVTGLGDYLIINYCEFDPQRYLYGYRSWQLHAPTLEFGIGSILLLIVRIKDDIFTLMTKEKKEHTSSMKNFTLIVYSIVSFCFAAHSMENQKLFDRGFNDGSDIEIIDQERMDNIYYRGGVEAIQSGLERNR